MVGRPKKSNSTYLNATEIKNEMIYNILTVLSPVSVQFYI